MTIASVLAHFYQNVLWFGGVENALLDAKTSLSHRTTGSGFGVFDYIDNIIKPIFRYERMFYLPGVATLLLAPVILKRWKTKLPITFSLSITFLIAGYSWYLLMPQHAQVHPFTVKHFGVFSAMVSGPILLWLWRKLKNTVDLKPKLGYYLLAFYVIVMALSQQVYALYIKRGFFHEYF